MRPPAELLDLPAEQGARWLALRWLEDAGAAFDRLHGARDDEALHDYRVALRRLRSHVRAYPGALRGSVGRGDRRRLRDLARATGPARDLEVQIGRLAAPRERADADEAAGVAWMIARLEAAREKADSQLRRDVARGFPRERRRLARRLAVLRLEVPLERPEGGPALAAVLAAKVEAAAAALEARLARVRGVYDQEEAHEGRIAAKRLRYLLEPFAEVLEGAATAVRALKKLQDLLGEMHDAHVLLAAVEEAAATLGEPAPGEADPRPGLRALAGRFEGERRLLFREVARLWLDGPGTAELLAAARGAAAVAAERGRGDVEIERKYLLKRMPRLPEGAVRMEIDQGWLPGERLMERIRRVRGPDGERYFRTVKLGRGRRRTEVEEETTREIFRALWRLTRGRRVRKTRFRVADGDVAWEIDRFRGRRLWLAEVELAHEDAPVTLPPWLARTVDREVTGDSAYVNRALAH